MSALFDDFAAAADYARHLATSSNQIISVFTDWDQWIVEPCGEDPSAWMDLILEELEGPSPHSLNDFFEYQAANDASFMNQRFKLDDSHIVANEVRMQGI